MREAALDDAADPVEDTQYTQDTQDTQAWHIISQADDHADQFPFGQPDTAARRKPVGIGQLTGGAKHNRVGGRPLTALWG